MDLGSFFKLLSDMFFSYIEGLNFYELGIDILLSIGVIIAAKVVIYILRKIIGRFFAASEAPEDEDKRSFIDPRLAATLRALFSNLVGYAVYLIAVLVILQIFNVDVFKVEDLRSAAGKLVQALIIFAVAKALLRIAEVIVDHLFSQVDGGKPIIDQKRAKTLSALLLSVLRYVVYFIAGIMVLQTFGVQTSSILASAGIAGLAVGFGAQNLVKDVISGFFIIFEDQFSVGEYVTVAGITGTVEEIGLRATKLREWTGHLHVIPNGEIGTVKNFERGAILAVITVGIAYEEDIESAIEVVKQTCERLFQEREYILEVPTVLGVDSLSDSSVDLLVTAQSKPGMQWAVQREMRKEIKKDLDAAGIEIPFPRRVVYHRTEEEGKHVTIDTGSPSEDA